MSNIDINEMKQSLKNRIINLGLNKVLGISQATDHMVDVWEDMMNWSRLQLYIFIKNLWYPVSRVGARSVQNIVRDIAYWDLVAHKNIKNYNEPKQQSLPTLLPKIIPPNGMMHFGDKIIDLDGLKYMNHKRIFCPSVNNIDDYVLTVNFYIKYIEDKFKFDPLILKIWFVNINRDDIGLFDPERPTENLEVYAKSMDLSKYKDIKDYIEMLYEDATQIKNKSDGVKKDDKEVFFMCFDLINSIEFGETNNNVECECFKTLDIVYSGKSLCGLDCINYCFTRMKKELMTEEEYIKKGLSKVRSMKAYFKEHGINIAIVGDFIKYVLREKSSDDFKNIPKKEYRIEGTDEKKKGRYTAFRAEIGDCKFPEYYYPGEDEEVVIGEELEPPNFIIIYNDNLNHYFVTDCLILRDDIYINDKKFVCKLYEDNGMELLSGNKSKDYQNKIKCKLLTDVHVEKLNIFFDYETVIDFKCVSLNKPYSLTIYVCNDNDLEQLDMYENEYKRLEYDMNAFSEFKICNGDAIGKTFNDFIAPKAHTFLGYDCTAQFHKYIVDNQKNKVYTLIGFNNCNFDNYILYNDLSHQMMDNVGKPFFHKGELLNFKIYGRHQLFDLHKHLGDSLKANCTSFDIKLCAKREGFSFDNMQQKYNDGILLEYIKDNEELKEYNKFDCISTALLFYRYSSSISEIKTLSDVFKSRDMTEFLTIGSIAYDKQEQHTKEQNIYISPFYLSKTGYHNTINKKGTDEEIKKYNDNLKKFYDDILINRVGGRCQLFNDRIKYLGRIFSMDCCALYAFICSILPVYYPCGIISFESFDPKNGVPENPDDLIRFYYLQEVDQSDLEIKFLAQKNKKENDWTQNILKDLLLSSPVIDYLKELKCKITYTGQYIQFSQKKKSCEMFGWMLEIMQLKNIEDEYKKNGDPGYNNSLRNVYKLISNIVSGKMNQRLILDKSKRIDSGNEMQLIQNEADEITDINIVHGKANISYKAKGDEKMKGSKPIFIGTLIYDYSRIYMHKYMYTKVPMEHEYYTATDSCKMNQSGFDAWSKYASTINIPHWKEVEDFEIKYKDAKIYNKDFKLSGSFENEYNNQTNHISYFEQKQLYMCMDTNDIKNTNFHVSSITDRSIMINNLNINPEDKMKQEDLYKIYKDNHDNCIGANYIKFFEYLHNNRYIDVLTFSMHKLRDDVDKNYGTKSAYTLKHLTV